MCQRSYWTRPSIDMSLDLFKQIIEQIPSLTSMKLQGIGEPLLNPNFFEMISHAKRAGLYVWSYTNATLLHLHDFAARLTHSGLDLLRISLDGTTMQSYEQIRIGANWNSVLNNIRLLVQAREATKSSLKIELWMVGMTSNIHQTSDLVKLGARLRVDAVRIQMLANTYSYNPEVGNRLVNIQIGKAPSVADHLSAAQTLASQLGITFEAERGKQSSLENKCTWPFTRTFISAEGLVVPCGTIADPRIVNFGSITEESFYEIWVSDEYEAFRNQHIAYEIPDCCRTCYGLPVVTQPCH
jgi:radical SAM protein with 4Fe4S-binding SPASM domain